jgi:hypothetical protein
MMEHSRSWVDLRRRTNTREELDPGHLQPLEVRPSLASRSLLLSLRRYCVWQCDPPGLKENSQDQRRKGICWCSINTLRVPRTLTLQKHLRVSENQTSPREDNLRIRPSTISESDIVICPRMFSVDTNISLPARK